MGNGDDKFITKEECERNRSSCALILKDISSETGEACGVAKDIHEDLKDMRSDFADVKEILVEVATIQKNSVTQQEKHEAKIALLQQNMWKLIIMMVSAGITIVFALVGLKGMGVSFP